MKFGVHVSVAGGLPKSVERAVKLGCETMQIFVGNPRGWHSPSPKDEAVAEFRKLRDKSGIDPVVVHMPYLANLASENKDFLAMSIEMAREQMRRSELLGADFLVCHMGKADPDEGMKRMVRSIRKVLGRKKHTCMFLLENTAGQGREMGRGLEEIGELLGLLSRQDVGLCLDTCHAHAAGYDLSSQAGFEGFVRDFTQHIDPKSLKVVHLNDSLRETGCRVDRHEHIGVGTIGADGFQRFLGWAAIRELPGILETPKKKDSDDLANLKAIRRLERSARK